MDAQKHCVAPVFPPPLSQLCSEWSGKRRTAVRLEGGGVALEVPEVSRENFLPKTDRAAPGGVAATLTLIALQCATKI